MGHFVMQGMARSLRVQEHSRIGNKGYRAFPCSRMLWRRGYCSLLRVDSTALRLNRKKQRGSSMKISIDIEATPTRYVSFLGGLLFNRYNKN
jgi:hypothetical protein